MSRISHLTWFRFAGGERITHIAWRADTAGHMVAHRTDGIVGTQAGTGIHTALVETGQAGCALRVLGALGTAAGWSTKVTREAATDGLTI